MMMIAQHTGSDKWAHVQQIRQDIRTFKADKGLDKVIVLWTANTERFAEVRAGINDTEEHLIEAIKRSEAEVSPSTIFAVASLLEGCSYINGSPQNTWVLVSLCRVDQHVFTIDGMLLYLASSLAWWKWRNVCACSSLVTTSKRVKLN